MVFEMKKNETKIKIASELRKRAEEKLKAKFTSLEKISSEDIHKLVHELQVHQIELEMQNEELRKTQVQLEESRHKYVDLYDFAPVGYLTLDENKVIMEANLTAASLLGIERGFLINKPFPLYIHVKDKDIFYSHFMKVLESKTRQTCEVRLKRRGNSEFYAQLDSILWVDLNEYNLYRTSVIDITERKRIENTLRKCETQSIQLNKMNALGTMIAGVAHELNNPLMGMLNFTQYCLKKTSPEDERFACLEDTERETKKCIAIVDSLLTFCRTGKEDEEGFQKCSCATILGQILKLLSYRVEKERVQVIRHYAEDIPEIWMRVDSIQQVFLNIIANALDALKESEKKEIHINMHCEDEFVQVAIADSGPAIAPENLHKIFDPFFTTKPPGQGTGLGLSICQSIVEMHEGRITCRSKPDQGAMFEILLPLDMKKRRREQNG